MKAGFKISFVCNVSQHSGKPINFVGPVPQSLKEGHAEVSRLLSLSISLDTLEGMLENDLTPPEVACSLHPHLPASVFIFFVPFLVSCA